MADSVLERFDCGDQGTFGHLGAKGLRVFSGELPPRNNAPGESCVDAGEYQVVWAYSPHLRKFTYRLIGVEGRAGILIHAANLMGDRKKGWKAQLLGCISPGEKLGWIDRQKAILVSQPAVRRIEERFGHAPFKLEIRTCC